ncbi:hypothetical protein BO70DRAFT_364201 [Aspergillus heteromorphus CBS 117.55]|uniref:Uncharacterized protein n=1 Tax=Aspergillus heteromorphus CBS 117.55 TaxID=1448321 RepID=A0A317VNG4_9EURO|nr:uncharacterized protein BO70DRAFT_364201 [Aspergillus heteromorphus CBS 117.55]PWY75129.1 hypothetical protein BO70DRAFT_364201 [Aspergillus heteromorphus CBS 117.55]
MVVVVPLALASIFSYSSADWLVMWSRREEKTLGCDAQGLPDPLDGRRDGGDGISSSCRMRSEGMEILR